MVSPHLACFTHEKQVADTHHALYPPPFNIGTYANGFLIHRLCESNVYVLYIRKLISSDNMVELPIALNR